MCFVGERGRGWFTTRSRRKQKHVNNACYEYEMYAIALATATTAVTASSFSMHFIPSQPTIRGVSVNIPTSHNNGWVGWLLACLVRHHNIFHSMKMYARSASDNAWCCLWQADATSSAEKSTHYSYIELDIYS